MLAIQGFTSVRSTLTTGRAANSALVDLLNPGLTETDGVQTQTLGLVVLSDGFMVPNAD